MEKKVLNLTDLRNNVDQQCIPIVLFVVLNNQFRNDKRTNLKKITYKNIKNWVDWGAKLHKDRLKITTGREQKYFDELFKGNWNVETFHQDLNHHINEINLKLVMQSGFTSKEVKEKINKGEYPLVLINPQYINEDVVVHKNPTKRIIRGKPIDYYHFVAIHGYEGENFFVYDCDLRYDKGEILSNSNIRCTLPFGVLHKFSQDINRLYWFELIDKSEKTALTQY
nr:hypothetical protein [Candidatus Woesearchaeota archaeon]